MRRESRRGDLVRKDLGRKGERSEEERMRRKERRNAVEGKDYEEGERDDKG